MAIIFQSEATLVQSLISVLEREQKTLVSADIESIEMLMDEKAQILQKISSASQARYQQLKVQGFEASEAGMASFIQSIIPNAEFNTTLNSSANSEAAQYETAKYETATHWMDFQKSLTQAKELNRVNGVLISRHFNRNREMLSDLQGNQQNKQSTSMIYGANGQQSGGQQLGSNYSGGSLIV